MSIVFNEGGSSVTAALVDHSMRVNERLARESFDEVLSDHKRAVLMAELSIGFSESWSVVNPAPIKVSEPQDNGTSFGLFSTTDDVPICFFGGVAFHPGRVAQPGNFGLDFPVGYGQSENQRRLIVLDTGWVEGEPPCDAVMENFPHDPDVPGPDLVLGHGPAIVDIASSIMGPGYAERVVLRQPDYFHGALGAATLLPAIGNDGSWTGKYVRAVDATSVEIALQEILDDADNVGAVLSLSLGAVVDRETPADQLPFAGFADRFREHGITVVAAAGNHGSDERMWPAAHEWVIAVGSGARTNPGDALDVHGFSGHGGWVAYYTDGENVPVNINGKWPNASSASARSATWTGTSFATPKVASMLAEGIVLADLPKGWDDGLKLEKL